MRLSKPLVLIRTLPAGRRLALRLWNRILMHAAPRRLARTYFGAEMDCDVRDMIQATIIHFGTWEPRASKLFQQLVEPGDTVVDIGANIGYYSMLFAKLVGPAGRVVAIEALPKLADIITAHARRNDLHNIRVVNVAASDVHGEAMLHEAPATNIGMTTIRPDRGFPPTGKVAALPLPDILTAQEMATVSLIKIDIEGAEIPVVRHFLDQMHKFKRRPAIAVEASVAENPHWSELFDRFLAAGFNAYDIHNDYDWMTILEGGDKAPTRITSIPDLQTDILFTPETI